MTIKELLAAIPVWPKMTTINALATQIGVPYSRLFYAFRALPADTRLCEEAGNVCFLDERGKDEAISRREH